MVVKKKRETRVKVFKLVHYHCDKFLLFLFFFRSLRGKRRRRKMKNSLLNLLKKFVEFIRENRYFFRRIEKKRSCFITWANLFFTKRNT